MVKGPNGNRLGRYRGCSKYPLCPTGSSFSTGVMQIQEEIVEVVQIIAQEPMLARIDQPNVDVVVPRILDELVQMSRHMASRRVLPNESSMSLTGKFGGADFRRFHAAGHDNIVECRGGSGHLTGAHRESHVEQSVGVAVP